MTAFDADRHPLDVLAEEFAARHRRGEHPSIEEYAEKHPELAAEIRALFPSVLVLERLTAQKEESCTSGSGHRRPSPWLQRLGDYHILREIGRGGMGVVYEARQESLGRRVALKVLTGSPANEKLRQRFEREARAAAQLHHTNIVPVFGVGREEGLSYYVMQYIDGESLGQVIRRLGSSLEASPSRPSDPSHDDPVEGNGREGPDTLPLADPVTDQPKDPAASAAAAPAVPAGPGRDPNYDRWVAQIGLQVAEALAYAHGQGVIHRDIKPANLLLDRQGKVWITDFGVARLANEEELTAAGDVVGTLRYMAPEQFNGEVDLRSDLYSLGLTLYELLALRPAFEETSRARLIRQLTDGQVPRLRTIRPDIPRDLETIIFKAIACEPEQRYSSAAALAEDLRCWLEDRPIRARRIGPLERLWRWCRRNRAVAALAGATLVSLVATATVGWIGYLHTTSALREARTATRRAEANLELSLQAFETIFNQVAGRDSVQPIGDDSQVEFLLPTVPSEHDLELLEELLQFYERFAAENQSNQRLRAETARAYRRVGEIQQKLGRLDEADEAFRRALAIYGALGEEGPPSEDDTIETAAVYNGLGLSRQLAGQHDDARGAFEQALELLDDLDSDRSKLERIRTHNMFGRLLGLPGSVGRPPRRGPRHHFRGRLEEAEEHHRQALALAQALIAHDPNNPDHRLALARSYQYLALIQWPQRTIDEALESNRTAIGLLQELSDEFPTVALYRQELAEAYLFSGVPSGLLSSSNQAAAHVEEAVRIAESLHAEYPQVPEYALLLARAISRRGALLAMQGEYSEALRHHHRSAELLQSLADRYPSIPWYGYLLASTRHSVGEQLRAGKRLAESRTELEKAITATETVLRNHPRASRLARFFLARQYRSLAATLRELGETELADETMDKARALAGPPGPHDPHRRRPPSGKANEG